MKLRYYLILIIMMMAMVTPFVTSVAYAANDACSGNACGLVTCEGNTCTFGDFMMMVNRIIDFFLFDLAPIFATLVFMYGGFKILTSQGNPGKISEARKIMWNVVVGYVIAMAAWLIVRFIFSETLVKDGFLFFIK